MDIDNLDVSQKMPCTNNLHQMQTFSNFQSTNFSAVESTIASMTRKTCSLDPLPTQMIKDHLEVIAPMISEITNQSLSNGVFPSALKLSHVRPLLKKPKLDKEQFNNYRPVSNIPFLAKVIEKIVARQTYHYLESNNLLPLKQSAYRKHHSTETALLKVTNDIFRALDQRQEVVLLMLDLSAAFDTLDHAILIKRLEDYFGFHGTVLDWYQSYLTNRCQAVVIDNNVSQPLGLKHGVPQGSILGPLLFTLYTAPLQDIITAHKVDSIFYADDSQLYITLNPKHKDATLETLRNCVSEVIKWNSENKLRCNPTKTEVIVFSSRYVQPPSPINTFSFDGTTIQVSDKVSNLGTTMDKYLSFSQFINDTCRKALFALRSIGGIRKYLSEEDLKRLVCSLLLSRLDYCNSLYYNLPNNEINKLQRVQNTAARLITGSKRIDHITPVLKHLHWLPILSRIRYKILLLVYKSLKGSSPEYIASLLNKYNPARNLRSSSKSLLQVPTVNTVTYGKRSFSHAAPSLWNTLSEDIKSCESFTVFKKQLKTLLFKDIYG